MCSFTRILALSLLLASAAFAQLPPSFSWGKYVTPARDQLRQGPCYTFAGVGATEIMYQLLGGSAQEFSKRQVYNCANPYAPAGDLPTVMNYLQNTGVIPATCYSYPVAACNPDLSDNGQYPVVYEHINGATLETNCGRRIRITSEDVTSTLRSNADAVKSLLINKGPIALVMETLAMHGGGRHAYVLFGWTTVNGQLSWLFNDSWPCSAGYRTFAIDLVTEFNRSSTNCAYVISSLTEEHYANGWSKYNLPINAFELEPANQVAKIVNPTSGCFNRGTYTLSGLNLLNGATIVDWSLRTDGVYWSDAVISPSGTVSGNASGVTVVATILRANGLLENITRNVGTVGMPVLIEKRSDACYGGRREIMLLAHTPTTPGVTTSVAINIPPSPDGKYYTIGSGSNSVYINYGGTGSITYNVTVQSTSTGCSLNYTTTRYVVALPCGY
ncbi:MAG: C1 family peptidase [Lacunisphaera sp.]